MLSSSHHPSYFACTVPFLVPYRDVSVTKYVFGIPSEYSFRTGKLLFYILAEVAMFTEAMSCEISEMLKPKRGIALQTFTRKMRVHLLTMLLQLSLNWDAPVFKFSAEMSKLLNALKAD
jgi:hypothetical protein